MEYKFGDIFCQTLLCIFFPPILKNNFQKDIMFCSQTEQTSKTWLSHTFPKTSIQTVQFASTKVTPPPPAPPPYLFFVCSDRLPTLDSCLQMETSTSYRWTILAAHTCTLVKMWRWRPSRPGEFNPREWTTHTNPHVPVFSASDMTVLLPPVMCRVW